jgi:hypothetical protein
MKDRLRSASIMALTIIVLILTSKRLPADTSTCGGAMVTLPFTDVSGNIFFCQIAEAYFSGLTLGTTPTTYGPDDFVRRDQMAAFVTRTQDSALRRGSRRAALKLWGVPPHTIPIPGNNSCTSPTGLSVSDGEDLWLASGIGVSRLHVSDGSMRPGGGTTSIGSVSAVLPVGRFVFFTGLTTPGTLYRTTYDSNTATLLTLNLGDQPQELATDGIFLWSANAGDANGGSVSRFNVDTNTFIGNITAGFASPRGILFDGANMWVSDAGDNKLKKLDSNGAILLSVAVGNSPQHAVFDGSNIWVPNKLDSSITVVRQIDGRVLATLTGNGLNQPTQTAFDGQRIMTANSAVDSGDQRFHLSLWKATDLTPIGTMLTSGPPAASVCSDGTRFLIIECGPFQIAGLITHD